MQLKTQLEPLFVSALESFTSKNNLVLGVTPEISLERPKDATHGDWACTLAMRLTKIAKMNPRDIAQGLVDEIPENNLIDKVEIAGPGFINIYLSQRAKTEVILRARNEQGDFGKSNFGKDFGKVNLEYVSANPTGPMHVGHGRWAALGDSMARVMRHAGFDVEEEFYINDHGVQIATFGNSIWVRYQQELGIDVSLPENCYGGSYVIDIAKTLIEQQGDVWLTCEQSQREQFFMEYGYHSMLELMKNTLKRFGNNFSCFFSERSLYVADENGLTAVEKALQEFESKGYIFIKDGATWFKSTAFGDTKDRVLIKENGEMTYFMSDCAYHFNKLQRGFTHLIDIWGADHHGYIKRCEAMLEAWGYPGKLEVVLGQLVNLYRNGEAVRMSKRTGEMVTFEELIDEVGVDATRYLMLSRSSDQQIDFDIEAAKRQDATNPVYYVQYAHARICSILRKAQVPVPQQLNLDNLTDESELALCNKLDEFEELILCAARDRAPFRLTHYAQELAGLFHQFYTNCRVIDEAGEVRVDRLALCDATRIVLALTLSLLGVSAPEQM